MDLDRFQKLGFSKNEVLVYLQLAEHGRCGAQRLAKQLRLARSTVYSVLDALERQKLVVKVPIARKTLYYIGNPKGLSDLIADEESRLIERKNLAAELVAEIAPLVRHGGYEMPKVEFFEGHKKVEKFLNDQLLKWRDSILRYDKSTWGYQDHSSVEQFKAWFKRAWQVLHVDAGIDGRILSNHSSVEKILKGKIQRREVRTLASAVNFESTIWVMGDYVIVIMTRRTPVYAFQIHEPLLASSLRVLFKILYNLASG